MIFIFIMIIVILFIYLLFKPSFKEGMLDLVPTISPIFAPTFTPTNKMLPKLNFTQVYRNYDQQISPETFELSQQNSNNISYLQGNTEILIKDSYDIIDKKQKLKNNVDAMQDQINQFLTQQTDYITKTIGLVPPVITGAVE